MTPVLPRSPVRFFRLRYQAYPFSLVPPRVIIHFFVPQVDFPARCLVLCGEKLSTKMFSCSEEMARAFHLPTKLTLLSPAFSPSTFQGRILLGRVEHQRL